MNPLERLTHGARSKRRLAIPEAPGEAPRGAQPAEREPHREPHIEPHIEPDAQAITATVVADTPYYWTTSKNAMIMTGDMLYTGDRRVLLGQDGTHRWVQVLLNPGLRAWVPRANFSFRGELPVVH